jgi:hypothetical protein
MTKNGIFNEKKVKISTFQFFRKVTIMLVL